MKTRMPDDLEHLSATNRHPICRSCPHLSTCDSSCWNEGRPGPGKTRSFEGVDGRRLTLAVTCRMCQQDVLTVLCPNGPSLLVPEGCPRFVEPKRGTSASECDQCSEKREDLSRRKNPERAEKAKELLVGYLSSSLEERSNKEAFGPLFVDADGQAERKRKMVELGELFVPSAGVSKDLSPGERLRWTEAELFLQELMRPVMQDEDFVWQVANHAKDWSISQHLLEWLCSVKWILEGALHDPEELSKMWAILFTELPLASRTWTRWSNKRRREMLETWTFLFAARPGTSSTAEA